MTAFWEELGIEFTPEPEPLMERRNGKWQLPADEEIARLREIIRGQDDWWSAHYERVCDQNRILRERLLDLGEPRT